MQGRARKGGTTGIAEPGDTGIDGEIISAGNVIRQHIAIDRVVRGGRNRTGIIHTDGTVINDCDPQGRRGGIAISVGNHDFKEVCIGAEGVVLEDIVIADAAGLDAGDDQPAKVGGKGLAHRGNGDTIDRNAADAIGRIEVNVAVGRLRIGGCLGALRLLTTCRQARFVDHVLGIDDADTGIVDLDVDLRFIVDGRDYLPFLHNRT